MDDLILFLREWGSFWPLIPFWVGVFRFRKMTNVHRALWVLVIAAVITEIVAVSWGRYGIYKNNLPLYHLYIFVEFALLARVFSFGFEGLLGEKKLVWVVCGFLGLVILNSLFFQPLDTMPTNTRTLESLLLLGFSLRYFFLVLKELKVFYLEKTFMFWVSSAILIFFSGNLLLFITSTYLLDPLVVPESTYNEVWAIHGFLNLLLYLLYSIALCLPLQPRKSPKYF